MRNEYDIDWSGSMKQTYEFYIVDPETWGDMKKIDSFISTGCSIDYDSTLETLGSAQFEGTEYLGECYVRAYLSINQNGVIRRLCLGTFLIQTPSKNYNGKFESYTFDGYTPIIELKTNSPAIGYSILADEQTNILETAYRLCSENMRAPTVKASSDDILTNDFISKTDDTWYSFISDFLAVARYTFDLDDVSRILFKPVQDNDTLQPVWIYNDDNSSILLPDISDEGDMYDIPNVVEVIYSNDNVTLYSRVVNDDEDSPVSTVNRGRVVLHREDSPDINGTPTQEYLDIYAETLLKKLSSVEHKVKYSHGYCPVRVGDCVILNYKRANLTNIKAVVVSQSMSLRTGCVVDETATYTTKLWG